MIIIPLFKFPYFIINIDLTSFIISILLISFYKIILLNFCKPFMSISIFLKIFKKKSFYLNL
jgi:hypothetical protein